MMDTATIREMTRHVTREARAMDLQPFEVWPGDADSMPPFPFPNLGDYRPKGWSKVQTYFVDSSGFGREGEAALSVPQFIKMIKVGYAYAIVEAGQFQVYIAEFKAIRQKGANNGRQEKENE